MFQILSEVIRTIGTGGGSLVLFICLAGTWMYYTLDRRRQVRDARFAWCLIGEGILSVEQLRKYKLLDDMLDDGAFLGVKG